MDINWIELAEMLCGNDTYERVTFSSWVAARAQGEYLRRVDCGWSKGVKLATAVAVAVVVEMRLLQDVAAETPGEPCHVPGVKHMGPLPIAGKWEN